jgi:hypothetical protein
VGGDSESESADVAWELVLPREGQWEGPKRAVVTPEFKQKDKEGFPFPWTPRPLQGTLGCTEGTTV